MADPRESATDKGLGLTLGLAALATLGGIGMLIGAPDIEAAWGFGAAVVFAALAVVSIQLWG